MNVRRRIGWRSAVGLISLIATASMAEGQENRILAVVNDDVITSGDVHAQTTALLQQLDPDARTTANSDQVRAAVLQRLIGERLMVQEAKRLGITVGLRDVLERLAEIQADAGTKSAYEEMLHDSQLTEEQLKQKIRDQLLVQRVIPQEVRSKLTFSPSELQGGAGAGAGEAPSVDEARIRHLVIRVDETHSREQAQQLAKQLVEQLRHGASFAELARQYSGDPDAEDADGSMGWVKPGELMPELDEVIRGLAVDAISDPIESHLGFHIVQVAERRALSATESAKAHQRLEDELYRKKFNDAMQKWLQGLSDRSYIEVADPGMVPSEQ